MSKAFTLTAHLYTLIHIKCIDMKHRVQLTLDEETFRYLRSLVGRDEAASMSHAVRRIVKEYRRLLRTRRERMQP